MYVPYFNKANIVLAVIRIKFKAGEKKERVKRYVFILFENVSNSIVSVSNTNDEQHCLLSLLHPLPKHGYNPFARLYVDCEYLLQQICNM